MDSKANASVWDRYVECALMFLAKRQDVPLASVTNFAVAMADELLERRERRFGGTENAPSPISKEEERTIRWEKGWWLGEGFVCVGGDDGIQGCGDEIPFPQPMYFTGEYDVVLCAACAKANGYGDPPKTPLERRPA